MVAIKRVLLGASRRLGMLGAWRQRNRYRIPILTLHGVIDDTTEADWRPLWKRMHVEQLERGLEYLRSYYEFVPLSEAVGMLLGERPQRPHCMALTLDDGYRDNYTRAMPIFERLGVSATFFVCSKMLDAPEPFWIDRLDYAIQHLPGPTRTVTAGDVSVTLELGDRARLAASYRRLRLALKDAFGADFDEVVAGIADELEAEAGTRLADRLQADPWTALMSVAEARDALRRGMEIGSHTVNHVRLAQVDGESARRELVDSRRTIGERLDIDCNTIAYPNGSFSPEVARMTQEAGYVCALSTQPGLNDRGTDPFALKRLAFPTSENRDSILAAASGLTTAMRSRAA